MQTSTTSKYLDKFAADARRVQVWKDLAGAHECTVTDRQAVLLDAIDDCAEAPSQTALVRKTGIDRSTLTDLMVRLEKRGLVKRVRTKQDARAYAVSLSDAGKLQLNKARLVAKKAAPLL